MVVLLEKDTPVLPPPPPYYALNGGRNDPSSSSSSKLLSSPSRTSLLTTSTATAGPSTHRTPATVTLPSSILLHILYATLPNAAEARVYTQEELARRTTRVLYWVAASARRVSRAWYLASMHILRSTYLQAYLVHVKKPYTSDPFPHSSASASGSSSADVSTSPVLSIQRETQVLDLFLLFHLRDAAHALDSALHLSYTTTSISLPSYEFAYTFAGADMNEADDAPLRDLFDFMQPRARLADLIRVYGLQAGLVTLGTHTTMDETITLRHPHVYAVPFPNLTVSFSQRKIGLILTSPSRHKSTIVSITRYPNEPLERCASRLVVELKAWADARLSEDASMMVFGVGIEGWDTSIRMVLKNRAEALSEERKKVKGKSKKTIRGWFGR